MLKIGITGGIGSGKTTVCQIFETLGIPIYYADARAKWLMSNDENLKSGILDLFGPEAYLDHQLNRPFIAGIVFQDRSKLDQLNQLVHPAVAKDSLNWHLAQTAPYTLKEAALLFESGSYQQLDQIIVVTAPKNIRIQRVMKRDQVEEAAVVARMNNQMPENEKVALANYIIYNDGKQALIPQVFKVDKALRAIEV